MSLPSPNLDDRTFEQLIKECQDRLTRYCPEWTDRTPGDPGMVLLELFAFLTETMIYRLNRLPDKAYIEFLRLLGVRLEPPAAAVVDISFERSRDLESSLEIPAGTRVSLARTSGSTEAVIFTTDAAAVLASGERSKSIEAHHCERIEGEPAGIATGLPGLSVTVARPPIIAPTGGDLDLVVGVETQHGEYDERARARVHDGKQFRIWREVDDLVNLGEDRFVYICDRMTGLITFAPAVRMTVADGHLAEAPSALGEVPPAGREIRVWYKRGGGPEGNVAANMKWTLKDAIPGVSVSNPAAAAGGRAAETLENALARGPQEIHSLKRAVTARDFELIAEGVSGSVARARAITMAQYWKYASPGTVRVLLVPELPAEEKESGNVTVEKLKEFESEAALRKVQEALDERRPLATICCVDWVRCKTARVTARVIAWRQEDAAALRERVILKLRMMISPLPTAVQKEGWRFGEALRAFHVFDSIGSEPGVSYVDRVRLWVDEVPEKDITCLAADPFHEQVWYAGSGSVLFRTENDTDCWEPIARFTDQRLRLVVVHRESPGMIAVIARYPGPTPDFGIHISRDCGETWELKARVAFKVRSADWIGRGNIPALLLASDAGLYELSTGPDATPVQIAVDASNKENGFYAVAVSRNLQNKIKVAVAAQSNGGVFLSDEEGRPGTFRQIGLKGEDARTLAVHQVGVRTFLWAGTASTGGDEGTGFCWRWELTGPGDPPDGWAGLKKGWRAGTCFGLAFQGSMAFAATHHGGAMRLDTTHVDAGWQPSAIAGGLPVNEGGVLQRLCAIAAAPSGNLLLAGGPSGVFASSDQASSFTNVSLRAFTEAVTIPPTWLFCSGAHEIEVISEDEAN